MFQCCGCDQLFSTLKAVRQHIASSIKPNCQARTVTDSAMGRRAVWSAGPAGQAAGAGAWEAASESGSAASRELKYFHRGLHSLRGQGPGYRIVIPSSASENSDRPGPGPSTGTGESEAREPASEPQTQARARPGAERPAAAPMAAARPEPLTGGTATLLHLQTFNAARVPSDVEELSMQDLALENEDWDHDSEDHDEDHPDPGKIKYWDILSTILKNFNQAILSNIYLKLYTYLSILLKII